MTNIMCYLQSCKSPLAACSDRWEGCFKSLLLLNDHLDHYVEKTTEALSSVMMPLYLHVTVMLFIFTLICIRGVEQLFSLSSKHQFPVSCLNPES